MSEDAIQASDPPEDGSGVSSESERQAVAWGRRLRHTPLRDLLRGRVSGRLDVRFVIAKAELPESVTTLIRRVVRRTRLWRIERVQIAQELVDHFRDGHTAGSTFPQLTKDFGDPTTAARLIRRAKIRNRNLALRLARACAFGIVVFYAAAWGLLMLGKPRPSVDYVEQLTANAAAISYDEAAWPVIRQAWLDAGPEAKEEFGVLLAGPNRGHTQLPLLPGDSQWLEAVRFLGEYERLIRALQSMPSYEGLGFLAAAERNQAMIFQPIDGFDGHAPASLELGSYEAMMDGSLLTITMPHLNLMRFNGWLLATDLLYAAQSGDGQRVTDDLAAMLALSDLCREYPIVFSDLIAHSIVQQALEAFSRSLVEHPTIFEDQQLQDIAHRLTLLDDYADIQTHGERLMILDLFQRFYTPSGRVSGQGLLLLEGLTDPALPLPFEIFERGSTLASLTMPIAAWQIADRDEMRRQFDALWEVHLDWKSQPFWELQAHSPLDVALEQIIHDTGRTRYFLILEMLPALDGAERTAGETIAQRDAVQVWIALELYRRDHGDWPESLAVLTPRYLPVRPVDHSTGQDLLYRVTENGPVLYGRGLDGIDNGAIPPPERRRHALSKEYAGTDWILMPPAEPTLPIPD